MRACGSYRCSIVPGLREVVVKQIVTFKDNTISSVGTVGDTASAVRHFNCTGTDTQGQCDSESPHLHTCTGGRILLDTAVREKL